MSRRPKSTTQAVATAARSASLPTSTRTTTVDEDAIRQRAYEIYVSRGANGGSPIEDWLQAERELSSRRRAAARSN